MAVIQEWRRFIARLQLIRSRYSRPLLCSDCFNDQGLALEARKVGRTSFTRCPHCKSRTGAKLNSEALEELARRFFVYGSFHRTEFGGASVLRFGGDNVSFPKWLQDDVRLLREEADITFAYRSPRTYLLGEVYPLDHLQNPETESSAADEVVRLFPRRILPQGEKFYRLRKGIEPAKCGLSTEYDSPPNPSRSDGRLDAKGFPVLYRSQDLEICVHECRVAKADDCYFATLQTSRPLEMLDLCATVFDGSKTPFESISLAVSLAFDAENHAYPIGQAIARAAKRAGLAGIIFPSYFSALRGHTIPNVGIFGRPIADGCVEVLCINKLILDKVSYTIQLGPFLPL